MSDRIKKLQEEIDKNNQENYLKNKKLLEELYLLEREGLVCVNGVTFDIKDGSYIEFTNYNVDCPHCSFEINNENPDFEINWDNGEIIKCPNCNKEFVVNNWIDKY